MSNKERFRDVMSKDFDKNKNYNIIKSKIENKNKTNKYFRYSLSIACLILVLFTIIIFDKDNTLEMKNNNKNNVIEGIKKTQININEVQIKQEDSDMDGLETNTTNSNSKNYINIPYYEILTGLNIPDDFDNKDYYKARSKELDPNSKDFGKINNYEYWYFNTKNNRRIIIGLSDKNIPLENTNIDKKDVNYSTINGVQLELYKYRNKFIAIFSYGGFNFNIDSTDITQEEFINLLESLIK